MTDKFRPEPPLPPDTDLSKLDGFMLNTEKLLGSELVALSTGDEFKAATLLWCRAWKQIPACSLPNNDKILASFAGLSLAKWGRVREMALRGFVECSDGRLYHMVLARDGARAAEAHGNFTEKREADRLRLKEWREAKRRKREAENETHNETPVKRVSETFGNADETSKTGRDGTVKEVSKTKSNDLDSGDAAGSFGFEGRLVRLTPRDLAQWRKAYHSIPDIEAELTTLDAYYDQELIGKDRKNWFIRCSSALDKKHQERVAESRRPAPSSFAGRAVI